MSAKKQKKALATFAAKQRRASIAAGLKKSLDELKAKRKQLERVAREVCRSSKARTRERIKAFRAAERERINQEVADMRAATRNACESRRLRIRKEVKNQAERAKLLAAERRRLSEELRELKPSKGSRWAIRHETDAEVEQNIEPSMVDVWRRNKARFQGSDRISRTEQFLGWLEENPEEVQAQLAGASESHVRELEKLHASITRKLDRAKGKLPEFTIAEKHLLQEQGIDPYDPEALGIIAAPPAVERAAAKTQKRKPKITGESQRQAFEELYTHVSDTRFSKGGGYDTSRWSEHPRWISSFRLGTLVLEPTEKGRHPRLFHYGKRGKPGKFIGLMNVDFSKIKEFVELEDEMERIERESEEVPF